METIFDLTIPQPAARARRDTVVARQNRQDRAIGNIFTLLQKQPKLRGVYAPADHLAETLRWSA